MYLVLEQCLYDKRPVMLCRQMEWSVAVSVAHVGVALDVAEGGHQLGLAHPGCHVEQGIGLSGSHAAVVQVHLIPAGHEGLAEVAGLAVRVGQLLGEGL